MISVLAVLASIAAVSAQSCTPRYGGHSIYDEVTAPDIFQVSMSLLGGSAPIVIEVNRTWSPVGADHFYALLRDGYFQCAAFYTIQASSSNSFAQTGIAADAEATTKWVDFIEDDEVTVARHSNAKYTLSYVPLDGFGTRSTHFMIHLSDNSYLDNLGYYSFAEVVDGFDSLTEAFGEDFSLSGDDQTLYKEGGNEWLLSVYSEDDLSLISSVDVVGGYGSSSSSSEASAGSWAFGVIMVVLASAACVYAGLYIYRYIRKQQGYDTMSADSGSGSSDRIVSLNLQQS